MSAVRSNEQAVVNSIRRIADRNSILFKKNLGSVTTGAGFPDITLFYKNRFMFIECKDRTSVSKLQAAYFAKIHRENNIDVWIVYGYHQSLVVEDLILRELGIKK